MNVNIKLVPQILMCYSYQNPVRKIDLGDNNTKYLTVYKDGVLTINFDRPIKHLYSIEFLEAVVPNEEIDAPFVYLRSNISVNNEGFIDPIEQVSNNIIGVVPMVAESADQNRIYHRNDATPLYFTDYISIYRLEFYFTRYDKVWEFNGDWCVKLRLNVCSIE